MSILLKNIFVGIAVMLLFHAAAAADRTIIVSKAGDGDFKTVQEAFNAVPLNSSTFTRVILKPGVYTEKVVLSKDRNKVIVEGESALTTKITWGDHPGKVVDGDTINTYSSASLSLRSDDIAFKNITVENSAGPVGQAVACEVIGDRVVFKNCRFLGCQDTFFTRGPGRIYLVNCYIEGTTDFIFGSSIAVFESCHIFSKKNSYVTAASTLEGNKFGYVFFRCVLESDSATTKVFLGRPWRLFAKTVFIHTYLGKHILSEGWHNWNKKPAESTAFYAEYESEGPGANISERVDWSRQLTSKEVKDYTLREIFAKDSYRSGYEFDWVPDILLKRL